nr:unnamed protein product [Digitaria exilis]
MTPGTGNSGFIFDSGTMLTYLTEPAYTEAKAAVLKQTDLAMVPDGDGYEACYEAPRDDRSLEKAVPSMVLHIDGADMVLPVTNYFVDMGSGVLVE